MSSHSSGGWNSKIKAPSGLVSPKTCLLVCKWSPLPPLHRVFPLFTHNPGVYACLNSSSNKNIVRMDSSTHMTSCNYNYLLKELIPEYSHILMESRLQYRKFRLSSVYNRVYTKLTVNLYTHTHIHICNYILEDGIEIFPSFEMLYHVLIPIITILSSRNYHYFLFHHDKFTKPLELHLGFLVVHRKRISLGK